MKTVWCPNCKYKFLVNFDPRSKDANSYYWGVVIRTMVEQEHESGYTQPEEWHGVFTGRFLYSIDDRGNAMVRSTTGLSKEEFGQFLEKIRLWVAEEFNITIPPPKEKNESKRNN